MVPLSLSYQDLDEARELLTAGLDTHRAVLFEGHATIARPAWLLGRALVEAALETLADQLGATHPLSTASLRRPSALSLPEAHE